MKMIEEAEKLKEEAGKFKEHMIDKLPLKKSQSFD